MRGQTDFCSDYIDYFSVNSKLFNGKKQNEIHSAKTVKFWPPKSNHAFTEIIKINAVTFLTAGHPDLNYFPGSSVAHNPCSVLVFTRSKSKT